MARNLESGGGATKAARSLRQRSSDLSTTETRPLSPFVGQPYRNENGLLEVYNGQEWVLQENEDGLNAHVNDFGNPHQTNAASVGLGNVNNTSDADKPVSTAQQDALDLKEDISNKDIANGYAGLDANLEVDKSAVPVLDLIRLNESAGVPTTTVGVTKIYSDGTNLKVVFGNGTSGTVTIV